MQCPPFTHMTGAALEQASISPSDVYHDSSADDRRHSPFRQGASAWNDLTLQPEHLPTLSGAVESSRWVAHLQPSSSARPFDHRIAPSPLEPPGPSNLSLSPLATLGLPAHTASMPSPEGLTVGQYLTSFPTVLDSPEQPSLRPLRRASGGEFETEVSATRDYELSSQQYDDADLGRLIVFPVCRASWTVRSG
jgi:hypothetical protein